MADARESARLRRIPDAQLVEFFHADCARPAERGGAVKRAQGTNAVRLRPNPPPAKVSASAWGGALKRMSSSAPVRADTLATGW